MKNSKNKSSTSKSLPANSLPSKNLSSNSLSSKNLKSKSLLSNSLSSKSLSSVLIANRGEIASRIIRTCKKMGIQSIAVFSDADKDLPYVQQADKAIYIGEAEPNASYLNQEKIIDLAKAHNINAIHPGYGFLSENADFAKKCADNNIIFIGPHAKAIEAMGSKAAAKKLMQQHQVPTIRGYQEEDQTIKTLKEEALKIGFPVLLKATAGGGGKGMRIVKNETEIETAIEAAKREAQNAFGIDALIIEKYIENGRHIEFQIFGDQHGNIIHILERECTIQRRYQKVIEESPSPVLTDAKRDEMGAAAVKAAQALNYDNAGTVEFIYDEQTGEFYFLEVNTRLQVEHPITEAITGLDLVQLQIESAQGLPLSIKQADIKGNGYAIEVRLYAEDANNNFLPGSGKVLQFKTPKVEGLRVETGIESGSEISIYYDPMIAKLIIWDNNRLTALRKMAYVLKHLVCLGITTNQQFLLSLVQHPNIIKGAYGTNFIKENLLELIQTKANKKHPIAATVFQWYKREQNRSILKNIPSGWRNNFYDYQKDEYLIEEEEVTVRYRYLNNEFEVKLNDDVYNVKFISLKQQQLCIEVDGVQQHYFVVKQANEIYMQNDLIGPVHLTLKDRFPNKILPKVKGAYLSPMPSKVIKILVKEGDKVAIGDPLLILSSMKMENQILAEEDGTVESIFIKENTNIEAGLTLLQLKTN